MSRSECRLAQAQHGARFLESVGYTPSSTVFMRITTPLVVIRPMPDCEPPIAAATVHLRKERTNSRKERQDDEQDQELHDEKERTLHHPRNSRHKRLAGLVGSRYLSGVAS